MACNDCLADCCLGDNYPGTTRNWLCFFFSMGACCCICKSCLLQNRREKTRQDKRQHQRDMKDMRKDMADTNAATVAAMQTTNAAISVSAAHPAVIIQTTTTQPY
eukprot:TRINITY_DN7965_c0_g1_i1.p1 TRINITY_DN7965_c0_g1~~TRINITY_DN7965_c0_g1_i1.p1  ORF type:complete len:105 (-),score=15.12 TRINITY_DN7965_c0_g1_i1:134-448(-)